MMSILNLAAAILLLAPALLSAQPQKSLVGFQGIPWGSGIGVVKSKFPNAQEFDFCKSFTDSKSDYEALKSKTKAKNSNCVVIKMENYVIDGVMFYVQFSFDAQGKLTYVTLTHSRAQSESASYIAECTTAYNRVSALLESRYGEYSNVNNATDFGADYASYAVKAWVPLPSEVWIANLSGDKFLKKMATEFNKPESDICKVKINYSKKVPSEASKL